ncbi:Clp protease N-terminal domain-containing protein [Saccharopolyspora sp. NPDC000359]|uniref:Clp protease N-terminal domain-containing protein n=1 Tax=Saccharopolyspora sp. NPDC000359 TaxID=3154251 RepID=UPI0033253BC0
MTMFERFTADARRAVVGASAFAELRGHPEITDEHLLLALASTPTTRAGQLLTDHGVDQDAVAAAYEKARKLGGLSDSDASALRDLGIDVHELVANVERSLGPDALVDKPRRRRWLPRGHKRFTPAARSALVGALREAADLRQRRIGDEHVLLALLGGRGVAADLLASHGVDRQAVRRAVRDAA